MKRKFLSMLLVAALAAPIISCGPSKEEIEAQKKHVADSIAQVEAAAKAAADAAAAEAAAKAAAEEAAAKAAAEEAAKKKGGMKKAAGKKSDAPVQNTKKR